MLLHRDKINNAAARDVSSMDQPMTEQNASLVLQQKQRKKAKQSYMKKLKRLEDLLNQFKDAKQAVEDNIKLISLDLEVFEKDQRCITEIGMTVRKDHFSPVESQHFLIKEYLHLKNGTHVDDKSDRFEPYFGKTRKISLQAAVGMVQEEMDQGPFIIVAQDGIPDMDKLCQAGLNVNKEDLRILDTKELFCTFEGALEGRRLGVILYRLNLDFWNLHNAGNDARYTLEVLLAIVSRPPIGRLQIPYLPEDVDDTAEITALVVRLMALGAEQAPSLQHAKVLPKKATKGTRQAPKEDITQEEWERTLGIPTWGRPTNPLRAVNQFDDPEESGDDEVIDEMNPVSYRSPILPKNELYGDLRGQFDDAPDDTWATSDSIAAADGRTVIPISPVSSSRGKDPYEESDHEYEQTMAFVGQKSGMTSAMAVFEDFYEYCSDLEDDENAHFHKSDNPALAFSSEILNDAVYDRNVGMYSHEILNKDDMNLLAGKTTGSQDLAEDHTRRDAAMFKGRRGSVEDMKYCDKINEGNKKEWDMDEDSRDEEVEDDRVERKKEDQDEGRAKDGTGHNEVPEVVHFAETYDRYEDSDAR